ncbi:YfcC family protein [Companilactobacillus sp.]|uniref:YfcC family protein n=1 Tax=Companilactobacillus sp. TaxID=2767905 RepID=UPI0025C28A29|nr:YfcC family protein [Companilactobacillus sp.]MCH4008368.1 YfcC family protein [Companilactobacillus sp.]MCH4051453.1 YfcC family protein [Companilactobacillus sp.]MCH4076311.1 YfcC family protein [Companilactobacillus sp.]MCH4124886.1 YfcC family protein [Companilactobacillus sp.]MCH4131428.1 YfcC family protein [Companilactobacillus sp.]
MLNLNKRLRMPSAFTILFLLIILVAILTWIVPAGQYETTKAGNIIAGTYQSRSSTPQGLWNIFEAPINGMVGTKTTEGAISVSLFIMVIGGFLGVTTKTRMLDDGIGSVVKKYAGREKILIPFLMILFAIGGSTFGMGEETIAFVPILVPIMVRVGYDSITAISISLIGSQVGCMASTVNPFATGVASETIHISPGEGIIPRLIFLVLTVIIAIIYVMHYAIKVKEDPSKSVVFERRQHDLKEFANSDHEIVESLSKRQKRVLVAFLLIFVVMICSLVPWTSLNKNFTFFVDFTHWITNVPFLGAFIGKSLVPLGNWYFTEITTLFLIGSVLIMYIFHMSETDFINSFMGGMSDLLNVAIIVAVARGIQVVMNDGNITATVLHAGETGLHGLSSSLFIVLTYIFYIPMSFLIPSSSGLAAATMGIMGPLGRFSGVSGSLVVTAYQSASGFVNLITPTSAIVMGSLAVAHINIVTWIKYVSKLMLILFVFTIIFLVICSIFKF